MERYYQPEIECAPREEIVKLQSERLAKQVRRVWENVPYYRRKMEEKIERLLKKCEKETTRYVKEHIEQIKELGKLLFEKKHLKSSEILSVLG